jgi:hypothetical protein
MNRECFDNILERMTLYGDEIVCALYDEEDIGHLLPNIYKDMDKTIQVLYFIKQGFKINIDIYGGDHPYEKTVYLNQAAWYTELYNILNQPSVKTDLNIDDFII